ncbi:MAG TPA: tRNA (adenosine(37)-N6)-threonylcarbamoyltransferase complex transferase subunit TsaD [Patescibacteria group bacterium]|nr:tRNA (adenosine(37)-N6)-threonylcarbamoyltransferase complex transferase subunit TsaD [Patescibacteria group bacterium]
MNILGIETSCDETGAAIIDANEHQRRILSNVLATSMHTHAKSGGIIPEIAARQQGTYMIPVIHEALTKAHISSSQLDAIAVTHGPGLIGSLLVGVETAKTLSYLWNKPLIPVNHLFGHVYANWISDHTIVFPAVVLIVSGGHTDLLLMKSHTDITWLGGTCDDAAGECFDKCARLLGYDYPGGPKIAQFAKSGDNAAFSFPRPMIYNHDYDFSFSGLKTSFLNATKQHFPLLRKELTHIKGGWQQVAFGSQLSTSAQKQILYNLCASLEKAIIDVLIIKTLKAARKYDVNSILLSGGVAANQALRDTFAEILEKEKLSVQFVVPEKSLCTDNAAMIAAAGFFTKEKATWNDLEANPQLYFA